MLLAPNRQRVIKHGEVFTPPGLVKDMLDLVAHECERIDSRFLEPACGDGNFLAEVLRRKLLTVERTRRRFRGKWERDAFLCVASKSISTFVDRYFDATGDTVSPGSPRELQLQYNKWGAECRIYFNSDTIRDWALSQGIHVEQGRPYQPDYEYRINNNDLWWELVEGYQYRLGVN